MYQYMFLGTLSQNDSVAAVGSQKGQQIILEVEGGGFLEEAILEVNFVR